LQTGGNGTERKDHYLKQENHVSHPFGHTNYIYLHVPENGADRDHMDGGTGTTELDQRLGMNKPRKANLAIEMNKWSSQAFPRRSRECGQYSAYGSTANSLSLHKPDLEESEPDKKAHTTNQWSLQNHFELNEKIHDWEESDPCLKKTFLKLRHEYEQKRDYLRSHQRLLLNFNTNVEEDVTHDNSEGDTRGNGHITSHYVLEKDPEGSGSCKQGPVDLFSRKCTLPELFI